MMTMMMIVIITVTITMPIIPLYTLQCRSYGDFYGCIVINHNYNSPSLLVTSAVTKKSAPIYLIIIII